MREELQVLEPQKRDVSTTWSRPEIKELAVWSNPSAAHCCCTCACSSPG
jgi:hypothetical protein